MGKLILVRAVRTHGYYPSFYEDGTKIIGSEELRWPEGSKNRANAGEPFWVDKDDFSPVRQVQAPGGGKRTIGWMERIDGGVADVPKRGRRKKLATQKEADASGGNIPHTRTDPEFDEVGRPKEKQHI